MKILTISTPYLPTENVGANGLGRHVYDYTQKMVESGHDVTIVCHENSNLDIDGLTVAHWDPPRSKEILGIPNILQLIVKENFDVIIDNSHKKLLSQFHSYRNLPILNFMHDTECKWHPPNALLGNEKQLLQFPKGKVIDTGIFFKNYKLYEEKKDYFCFCAKLEKRKGYDIAAAVTAHTGIKTIFAGPKVRWEPNAYQEIPNWIGEIRNHEEFCDFVGSAKAIFCPSRLDAGGLVLWEAAALGTPVLTTIASGAQCNVVHGKTGYVANTFEELCEFVSLVDDLNPAEIREIAKSKWDLDSTYDQFEETLQSIKKGERW